MRSWYKLPTKADIQRDIPAPWPMVGSSRMRGSCGITPETTFLSVKSWIRECTENHELCNTAGAFSEGSPPKLPKRVLDLGTNVLDSGESIRLRSNVEERDEYVCLSYCWGDIPILKTTSENISEHENNVAWSSLNKTFQDAIRVTRALGIRWLWIDALCIIQDDRADWALEAAKMALIYENSLITLAATGSKDGNGGLFNLDGDRELIRSVRGTETGSLRVRCDDFCYRGRTRPLNPDMYPTMYRGWCYQERLLARRVLHFGRQELFWECKSLSTCECQLHEDQPDLGLPKAYEHLMKDQLDSILHNPKLELRSIQPEDPSQVSQWHQIVTRYTRLGLKYPSDRLPAISGIAKVVQRERDGTRYLAGVWKDAMPADLTWFVNLYEPSDRAAEWRAPSWTWAAVDQAVDFPPMSKDMAWLAEILDGCCEPSSSDPTGPVSSGFLKISGAIGSAVLSRNTEAPGNPEVSYIIRPASTVTKDLDDSSPHWNHVFFPDFRLPELETANTSLNVYCLALVTDQAYYYIEPYFFKGNYYTHAMFYLVLRAVSGESTPTASYERIGLGRQEEWFPGDPSKLRMREVAQIRSETLIDVASGNMFPKGIANTVSILL